MQQVLHCEFGGMNEVLTDLAEHSGDGRFLKLAERFYHGEVLNDISEEKTRSPGVMPTPRFPKLLGQRDSSKLQENRSMPILPASSGIALFIIIPMLSGVTATMNTLANRIS